MGDMISNTEKWSNKCRKLNRTGFICGGKEKLNNMSFHISIKEEK